MLLLVSLQLVALFGVGGASIALPLQHMADEHTQQAQEEEHRHQNESNVLWVI